MTPSTTYTLAEIAAAVSGSVEGDGGARVVTGPAALKGSGPDRITYLEDMKLRSALASCEAAGVIVGTDVDIPESAVDPSPTVIRVAQPVVAWTIVLDLFRPYERSWHDVSAQAYVGEGVELGEGVGIGPGAVIADGVEIGPRTEIFPGVSVGRGTKIGADCRIYSGAHIYHDCTLGDRVIVHSTAVIGADGYGYVQERREDPAEPVVHRKVPQIGTVILEDDVEIGAGTTIDRAALDATVIGRGTKVDNQVMVGHNCRTGVHCLLIAQVGISGSTELGHYVTIAGQSGIAGHLKIGDGAKGGARTGIMKNIDPGGTMLGSPALPGLVARRAYAQIEHLPEFRRTLKGLEKRVTKLEDVAPEEAADA